MLHLDVMDGHFVPNLSFGAPVIASLRRACALFFDVHLMIAQPLFYIESFARAGAGRITFHAESESDIAQTIAAIRARGVEAGLALKPGTPAEVAFPFLGDLAMVLVMTVEPGFGGQAFMRDMLPKIRLIRERCKTLRRSMDIQVDGGIDGSTDALAARAGANVLVAGSSLFGSPDYRAAVSSLRASAEAAV
jgi:ribulose-phosphate 3-epimerase